MTIKSHVIWNENNPYDKVKKGEVIRHKDEDHDNNAPENQEKMTKSKHTSPHKIGNENCLGYKNHLGHKHTEKAKRKISLAHPKYEYSKQREDGTKAIKKQNKKEVNIYGSFIYR